MQISARISPDDHRDILNLVLRPGKRRLRARMANLNITWTYYSVLLGMSGFAVMLVRFVYLAGVDELLRRPVLLVEVLVGLLLVPVTIAWLRSASLLRGDLRSEIRDGHLDRKALLDGWNIGETEFEIDARGIRASRRLVEEFFSWEAFQELTETEENFFLMIDAGSGEIIPKRAFSDDKALQSFRALVGSRITASTP